MSFLLPFLLRYWKPLLVVSVAAAIVGGIYFKGRSDKAKQIELQAAKETVARIEKASKVKEKFKKIREKLDEVRKSPNPDDLDKHYTELLSNPPSP